MSGKAGILGQDKKRGEGCCSKGRATTFEQGGAKELSEGMSCVLVEVSRCQCRAVGEGRRRGKESKGGSDSLLDWPWSPMHCRTCTRPIRAASLRPRVQGDGYELLRGVGETSGPGGSKESRGDSKANLRRLAFVLSSASTRSRFRARSFAPFSRPSQDASVGPP
jgi:hypothetical protein